MSAFETAFRLTGLASNNSFKPNLLRYGNRGTKKRATVAFTTQVGLTQALGFMTAFLAAIGILFLAVAVAGAISKRWFPRAGVTISLAGLTVMFAVFLALLAVDALNGQVQNYGHGTGVVLLSELPVTFWALVAMYALAASFGLGATIWAIRKHLKGQMWPPPQ